MQKKAFYLKPIGSLTASDFEHSLLWAGYYEPDDVEEIAKWGIPKPEIIAALDEVGWQDDHYFPLPVEAVDTDWMRGMFYAAAITCADGTSFAGYVGEGRATFYVFTKSGELSFSTSWPVSFSPSPGPLPLEIHNRVTADRWYFPFPG